jgi:hypothetical protein
MVIPVEDWPMDVLLAPVYESFLAVHKSCLECGGFVVGPIGVSTAENLFTFACEAGRRDEDAPCRFNFAPWLPGIVYESHVESGEGGFRYMGLIDQIEINDDNHIYRFPKMKPGEGHHGEKKFDERMPAFVRFRILESVADITGMKQLWPASLGLKDAVLRHFMIRAIRDASVQTAFKGLLARSSLGLRSI